VCAALSGVARITGSVRVGSLVSVSNNLLGFLLANGQLVLELVLEVTPGHVRVLVPNVVVSRLVDLVELILRRLDLVGSVHSGIAGDVPEQGAGVRKKLPELAVGDEQRAESAETVEGLVTMLLCGVLVHGGVGKRGIAAVDLLSLPDEVLEKVALVFCEKEDLGLLDDLLQVTDKRLSFSRELLGG
jgi:uncharacterized membrane protein